VRQDAFEKILACAFHGITKEQTAKSMTPRIGVQTRQTQPFSIVSVDAPPDRGVLDPIANQGEMFILEPKLAS
jgi:hypothetical protein